MLLWLYLTIARMSLCESLRVILATSTQSWVKNLGKEFWRETLFASRHTNLIRWFAINVATQHPLLTAIPIGLPYEPVHRKEADEIDRSSKPFLNLPPFKVWFKRFRKCSRPFQSRRKLLYVKFTLDERNFAVRSNVKNIIERNFASRSNVDYGYGYGPKKIQ
jgi:hypothetical protein